MKIITKDNKITLPELHQLAEKTFGDLVKAVVDIEQEIMALDGDLHADEEQLLLENGSQQKNIWGINIYPNLDLANLIEFDSLINLRPRDNNLSRGVDDTAIQEKIKSIVNQLIKQ